MAHRRWHGAAAPWGERWRPVVSLLPLLVASILIVLLATTAGSAPVACFFQSPVSPISPVSSEAPAAASPAVAQETPVGPTPTPGVLRAVPTALNFWPWVIGLVVIVLVVGAVLYWRSRREGEEDGL
jgi:hypothetical protein